uniref:Uncharacterized protein n=1 Tax=Anguilla anguilla TaxID=7936 RepID=A0A0E9WY43_ANGAN
MTSVVLYCDVAVNLFISCYCKSFSCRAIPNFTMVENLWSLVVNLTLSTLCTVVLLRNITQENPPIRRQEITF